MVTSACPLCGGTSRFPCLRHPEGVLARCLGCGLVSVDPLPSPAVALRTYDAAYFRGETGYRDYVAEEAVFAAEFRRRLRAMAAAGARGGRLLDVGAASGAFLVQARDAGFDVAGIEPTREMAASARARGLDVRHAPIESADFPAASFDVATCFDVLEHLVDPVAAVRRIRSWLRPSGILAVTVPDFGGLWARATGARWPFVTPREHLHYFTRRTLARLLRGARFGRVEFPRSGTPVSFGELAREVLGGTGRRLERALGRLADRGLSLPFGSLFAVAASSSLTPREPRE